MEQPFNPTIKTKPTEGRSAQFSRRDALKALGFGAIGLTGAARLIKPTNLNAQSPAPGTLFSTTVVDLNGNTIQSFSSPSAYSQGMMFLGTTTTDQSGSTHSDVQFIDVNNQSPAFSLSQTLGSFPLPSGEFQSPITDGTYYYVGSGDFVAQCDFTSYPQVIARIEGVPSAGVGSALVVYNGQLIFLGNDGKVYSFSTLSLQPLWNIPVGSTGGSITLVGNTLYALSGSTLGAIDLLAQAVKWPAVSVGVSGPMVFGNGSIFVSSPQGSLVALNSADGSQQWSYPASGSLSGPVSPVTPYNGSVYFLANSVLYRVDALSGNFISSSGTAYDSASAPQLEDGQCYVTSGNGTSSFTMYSISSDLSTSVEYAVNSPGAFIGVENGVAYFTHMNGGSQPAQVAAHDFGAQQHGFFCESELMADAYVAGTSGATTPSTASFRTHIQLVDPTGTPRANKSVRVWCSADPTEPATLISGSVSAQIDSSGAAGTGSVWLTTDSAGELSLVIQADNISCPALYLYGTFMSPGEAIVIYPDHDTANTLAGVSSGTLQSSQSFTGNLLPSGYDATDLSTHINRAFQGSTSVSASPGQSLPIRSTGTDHRRPKKGLSLGSSNPYIAYPGSTPNMTYYADLSNGTDRTFAPSYTSGWSLSIDQSTGAATLQDGVLLLAPDALGFSFSKLKDLVDRVVKGVEKVVSVAVSIGTSVLHAIKTDAGNLYNITINAIEAAVASVASVLKTIATFADNVAGAIVKVAEAFSSFFQWGEIFKLKDQLKGQILGSGSTPGVFQNLQSWIALQGSQGKYDNFSSFYKTLTPASTNQGTSTVGTNSIQSQQVNGNDPQDLYSKGGTPSYTKSRWMTSKVKENAGQASTGSSSVGISLGDALGDFETAISNMITIATQSVSSTQIASLKSSASSLGQALIHPSDLVTKGLGTLLDSFLQQAVTTVLEFSEGLITGFFDNIALFVEGIVSILNTPISTFPVIGDLWKLVTGGSLPSFLDVACLMVAVPAFFIEKLTTTGEAVGNAAVDVIAIISNAIYVIVDTANEIFEEAPPVLTGIYLALSVLVFGLSVPVDLATNPAVNYTLWALQLIPILAIGTGVALGAYSGANALLKKLKDAWDGAYVVITFIWSVIDTILTFVFAFLPNGVATTEAGPSQPPVGSVNVADLIGNLCGIIPYFFQILGNGPSASPSRLVLAGIDFVCDATAVGIQVAES
jgi:outer membrane protein assembly factor BamB